MSLASELDAALVQYQPAEAGATVTLRFAGSEVFFNGHFPERPLLPAFVQLAAAVHFASRVAGHALKLVEASRATFLAPAGPGVDLMLALSIEPVEDGLLRIKASLRHGEQPVAELSLRVQKSDAP